MQSSEKNLLNSDFSHIYIERQAVNHPVTKAILEHFPNAVRIEINHYKDIFCRAHQDFSLQKTSRKLILALKKEHLVYKGAEVCESFGNENFYYTSSMMNCIYDCEYCYLQGMYPSANIVAFVNIEDTFDEVETMLAQKPIYLCISYDTDMLAFENVVPFTTAWLDFTRKNKDLTIEIRTKSANFKAIKDISPLQNVILAWTISPAEFINKFEKKTPSFGQRLESAKQALECGWNVRLCFDPLLFVRGWQENYEKCIDKTFNTIEPQKIYDISIGFFRMSRDFLKRSQKVRPSSSLFSYPFECENGVCSYSKERMNQMKTFIYKKISQYINEKRIYIG